MNNFSFTITTTPKCSEFLKIKMKNEEFKPINEFITIHKGITEDALNTCVVKYRGQEKTYKEFIDEHVAFSNDLKFIQFNHCYILIDKNIIASKFFIEKSANCLQNARFFLMQSQQILDLDTNVRWIGGYGSQFMLRCIYFDTAITWYSNTFDQLLQAVYWAYELYTSIKDRDDKPYNDSWNVKEIMKYCTYEFVVSELKARNELTVRKLLTSCSGKIEEVRNWANYVKHKGGIEYKYLEPDTPFEIYIQNDNTKNNWFKIEDFKSPIEIDIDDKIPVLVEAHKSLHECITNVIEEIKFEKYILNFGGDNNEQNEIRDPESDK